MRLGKYHSKDAASENSDLHPEEESTQQIIHQEQSAAGILCKVKSYHAIHASNLSLIKDVLGIVATLARVDNDTLSRLVPFHTHPFSFWHRNRMTRDAPFILSIL